MEISVENLAVEHLHNVEYVDACAATDRVRVWSKNSLPAFVGKDTNVPETKTLFVRVTSTSDADMELLKTKLDRLWHSRTLT
jgi:hypothetical protein